ncbi:hypothetical protein GCM10023066_15960 [Nocardioides kongjuensis]
MRQPTGPTGDTESGLSTRVGDNSGWVVEDTRTRCARGGEEAVEKVRHGGPSWALTCANSLHGLWRTKTSGVIPFTFWPPAGRTGSAAVPPATTTPGPGFPQRDPTYPPAGEGGHDAADGAAREAAASGVR